MTESAPPGATPGESPVPQSRDEEAGPPASPKIKIKKPRQRACDEKDPAATVPAKGQVCCGHLKRWYDYPKEIEALVGKNAEIYRCENCKTIYKPDPRELPRSYVHRY